MQISMQLAYHVLARPMRAAAAAAAAIKVTAFIVQAGAAAVSADQNGLGSKHPASTAPSGPTPMDTDQAILNSALGTSGRAESASAPEAAGAENSAGLPESASDAAMTDVDEAAQQSAQQGVTQDSMLAESAALTGPSGANESALTHQGSAHEQEVAQLGFAVQLTVQGLRNGAGPTLMPLLVRLLPFLLKTQVYFFIWPSTAFSCRLLRSQGTTQNMQIKHKPAI